MDLIATFKKYLIKTTLIVGLVVLSTIGIYTSCNTRVKLSAVRSELDSSKDLNNRLGSEKLHLETLINTYKDSISKRDIVILAKDKLIKKQLSKIDSLKDSLKHNMDEVVAVTADSSYRYINQRIIPKSERKYPFDSTQVKGIHRTFIERDGLYDINTKYGRIVNELTQQSSRKDNQIVDLNSLVNVYMFKEDIIKKESEACKVEVVGLKKSGKQQKFLKDILFLPAGIGVLAVIVKILK